MNLNPSIPTFIAKYTDLDMTKGIQGLSSEEIDGRLD